MNGWLIAQVVMVLLLLVMSLLARLISKEQKVEADRRHWALEQSVYLVGAMLACVNILGGFR